MPHTLLKKIIKKHRLKYLAMILQNFIKYDFFIKISQ